jgi:hypothetical protein
MSIGALLDKAGIGAYNTASRVLTGEPTPGSAEAVQRQLEKVQAQRRLQEAQQPAPRRTAKDLLADYRSLYGVQAENLARTNDEQLRLTGASNLLEARGAMNQQNIDTYRAQTRNQQDLLSTEGRVKQELLDSKAQANLALLDPVLANERYGLDADSALSREYLAHDMAKTQEILKAQQSAQTLPMIAGLLATAAALFA